MNQTMLIADDNKMNREILQMLFQEQYLILEAENGQELMEILESCQGHVDVVLLDLFMPGMDGFSVLEKRQQLDYFKDVPVVVITASNALEDQLHAFSLGVNDFINKPFVPEIVISRVSNVMASHRRMLSVELEARRLKIKSELDQMTGLYNKVTTEMMIDDQLLSHCEQLHALLVIDIDNFKSVNDTSGHLAGDHTIRIVADLISSQFRKSDIVGRIGGDEFAVLMVNVCDMQVVRTKVNQLIQLMKYKPNLTLPENVSLSIGVASSERGSCTYRELFAKADQALYQAKLAGKARYREFGTEFLNVAEDQRPIALLLSRDRGVCGAVHTLAPAELNLLEVLDIEDLDRVGPADRAKTIAAYVDVTGEPGDGAEDWQRIKESWLPMKQVMALCREGDLAQGMAAILAGVADVLTIPLDSAGFKRRTERLLGRFLTSSEPEEKRNEP